MSEVSVFIPCMVDLLLPEVGDATFALLRRLGVNTVYHAEQTFIRRWRLQRPPTPTKHRHLPCRNPIPWQHPRQPHPDGRIFGQEPPLHQESTERRDRRPMKANRPGRRLPIGRQARQIILDRRRRHTRYGVYPLSIHKI